MDSVVSSSNQHSMMTRTKRAKLQAVGISVPLGSDSAQQSPVASIAKTPRRKLPRDPSRPKRPENGWIRHVKEVASSRQLKFADALRDNQIRETYLSKKASAPKVPQVEVESPQ